MFVCLFFAKILNSDGSQNHTFRSIEMVKILKSTLSIPVQNVVKCRYYPSFQLTWWYVSYQVMTQFAGKRTFSHAEHLKILSFSIRNNYDVYLELNAQTVEVFLYWVFTIANTGIKRIWIFTEICNWFCWYASYSNGTK